MDNCIFCKIVQKQIPAHVVYEDQEVLAFLDIKPINPGHTLVIPKKHFVNLFDIDEATWAKVAAVTKKVAAATKKATNAAGINLGMNNDSGAGQLVMHAHVHVMPRRADDKLRLWPGKDMPQEELKKLSEQIRQAMPT
jgi:histidine triad (HIT) family protein